MYNKSQYCLIVLINLQKTPPSKIFNLKNLHGRQTPQQLNQNGLSLTRCLALKCFSFASDSLLATQYPLGQHSQPKVSYHNVESL